MKLKWSPCGNWVVTGKERQEQQCWWKRWWFHGCQCWQVPTQFPDQSKHINVKKSSATFLLFWESLQQGHSDIYISQTPHRHTLAHSAAPALASNMHFIFLLNTETISYRHRVHQHNLMNFNPSLQYLPPKHHHAFFIVFIRCVLI